jgi:hypothetical protein
LFLKQYEAEADCGYPHGPFFHWRAPLQFFCWLTINQIKVQTGTNNLLGMGDINQRCDRREGSQKKSTVVPEDESDPKDEKRSEDSRVPK